MFDEYTRRQYVAKAPKRNPFGVEDEPAQFNEFDVFTKIRILQQLSVWTLNNPNPIRERLDERESEQISWVGRHQSVLNILLTISAHRTFWLGQR
jgi:hypothetical protein